MTGQPCPAAPGPTRADRLGRVHFPAMEAPDDLAADLREFLGRLA